MKLFQIIALAKEAEIGRNLCFSVRLIRSVDPWLVGTPRVPSTIRIPKPIVIAVASAKLLTTAAATATPRSATAWRWGAVCAPVKNYLSGSSQVLVTTDCAVSSLGEVIARALRLSRACGRGTAKVCCQRLIPIVNSAE